MDTRTGRVKAASAPMFPCGQGAEPHLVFDFVTDADESGVFYVNLQEDADFSKVLIVLEGLRSGRRLRIGYQARCLSGTLPAVPNKDPGGFIRHVEIV